MRARRAIIVDRDDCQTLYRTAIISHPPEIDIKLYKYCYGHTLHAIRLYYSSKSGFEPLHFSIT